MRVFEGVGKSRGMVRPIVCGRNGSLGFVVSCGGFWVLWVFFREFGELLWVFRSKDVAKFDGENVVDCWWDVVNLWFFDGV
jgi:hypothetical protein